MCVEVDCLAAADFDYGGGGDGGAGGLQSVLTGLHNPVSRQSLLPALHSTPLHLTLFLRFLNQR